MDKEYEYSELTCVGIKPQNMYLYDTDGKVVLCTCGNPADRAIFGLERYVGLCTECLYGDKDEMV